MYKRFLNNNDYLGITTSEVLAQMTRGNAERFIQAEEAAEISIVEYLSENYEIETELAKGKYIAAYDRKITFPIGAHVYWEDNLYEVIRSISGYKAPADISYWEEYINLNIDVDTIPRYSQFGTYHKDDIVQYNDIPFICLNENGYQFGEVRVPMVNSWIEAFFFEWEPVEYALWDVVRYDNAFYTLMTLDGFDNNLTPMESDSWGAIADYDSDCNEYQLSGHEYVVYRGAVYYPEMDVNADTPVVGQNIALHDPRNYNLKKHMLRLAMYELSKLIAPNNVSIIRVKDYETSMKWLSDAAKLKLNPQIPRRLSSDDNREVMDWQLATFQTNYDPYQNPWLT